MALGQDALSAVQALSTEQLEQKLEQMYNEVRILTITHYLFLLFCRTLESYLVLSKSCQSFLFKF